MGFDLDPQQRRQLGHRLIDRINEYFSTLKDRPVQQPAANRSFQPINDVLPELGDDAACVLDDICTQMIDEGFHTTSANYFGLMNPTPTYIAVLAEALVAALNPQLASLSRSQLASKIEHETVRWIAQRAGWTGDGYGGTFTSGGNEANLSALALALTNRYPHAAEDGLLGLGKQPVVYASSESHHSLDKSLGLLGLGRKALRRISVNDRAEIDVAALEQAIADDRHTGFEPLAIVGTAGTTNSGAVDPLEELAAIARNNDLWFHVDGAYGGAVIFSDRHRPLVAGIELADSITIDPHKWLAMPYSAGVMLTRHPQLQESAFSMETSYLPRTANNPLPDNFRISAQWSRRMNSLKLWLTLRIHGRQAYEELIDSQLQLAEYMEQRAVETGAFKVAVPRKLTILNLRATAAENLSRSAEATKELHDSIARLATDDGKHWISNTVVNGCSVLRMMVISYLSDRRNVDSVMEQLRRAAELTVVDRATATHSQYVT